MRLIEFAGISGSGKSTLFRWAASRYQIASTSNAEYLLSAIRTPEDVDACLREKQRLIERFVQQTFVDEAVKENTIALTMSTLRERYILEKMLKDDSLVLCDEGIVQRAAAIFLSYKDKKRQTCEQQEYLRSMVAPHAIFYIKTEKKRAFKRMKERQKFIIARFRMLKDAEILDALDETNDILEEAVNYYEGKGAKIIRIHNDHSMAAATRIIAAYMSEWGVGEVVVRKSPRYVKQVKNNAKRFYNQSLRPLFRKS